MGCQTDSQIVRPSISKRGEQKHDICSRNISALEAGHTLNVQKVYLSVISYAPQNVLKRLFGTNFKENSAENSNFTV